MSRLRYGITFKILSVCVFVGMASLIKAHRCYGGSVPPGQAVFFRSLFAIPSHRHLAGGLRGELHTGLAHDRTPWGHVLAAASSAPPPWGWALRASGLLPLPEVTASATLPRSSL